LQHVAQLHIFGEHRIVDGVGVGDAQGVVARTQVRQGAAQGVEFGLGAENTHVVPELCAHFFADGVHLLGIAAVGGVAEAILPAGGQIGEAFARAKVGVAGKGRSSVTGDFARHHRIGQRVAAKAVCAVDGHARSFTSGKQAGHNRGHVIKGIHVNAAHGVVGRGADDHGLVHKVDIFKKLAHVANLRQIVDDLFLAEVPQVKQHIGFQALAVATTLADFRLDGAGHDVAGAKFHLGGGVSLHEAFALVVEQIAAFAAGRFGNQHAAVHHARGVELHHFGILEGNTRAQGSGNAVACGNVGGGGAVPENAGIAAGGKHHGLGAHRGDFAGADVAQHGAFAAAIIHGHVKQLVIHEEFDAVAQGIVQAGVGNDVAGLVGGVVATHLGRAAKGTGLDLAFSRAREGHAQIIQFKDGGACLLAEFERGFLVNQIVAALHGIKAVQLVGVTLAEIGDAVDAAFGHTGGAARRHAFADHNHVELGIFLQGCHGGSQASATRSDDQDVAGGQGADTSGCGKSFFNAAHVHRQRADGDAGRLQKFSAGKLLRHKGFLKSRWICRYFQRLCKKCLWRKGRQKTD